MFTGIVESKSEIITDSKDGDVVTIRIKRPVEWDLKIGQSIAVNGACLTLVRFTEDEFSVEMMQETLDKTSFGRNIPTDVNLERAMLTTDRFEGHIVQGHVDTVGEITNIEREEKTIKLTVKFDSKYKNLVVEKGSITVDGVSLTIVDVGEETFSVSVIPHTLKETTFGLFTEGDIVNLEFDIVGKYIIKTNS